MRFYGKENLHPEIMHEKPTWHYFLSYHQEYYFKQKRKVMPQKHHEEAARHNEEAAKHHKEASKHASKGDHEKAAYHAQAAHAHQHKANEHSAKASHKYAEKKGTMKNEEMEENGNQQKHKSKAAQD
jgi:hypothetical protein